MEGRRNPQQILKAKPHFEFKQCFLVAEKTTSRPYPEWEKTKAAINNSKSTPVLTHLGVYKEDFCGLEDYFQT